MINARTALELRILLQRMGAKLALPSVIAMVVTLLVPPPVAASLWARVGARALH